MTMYDKGLVKAMKVAYRNGGYDVAMTDNGCLIQTDSWGVEIVAAAVPNSVKSLIVLHSGAMPRMNSAIHVAKGECSDVILETVVGIMDSLNAAYTATGGRKIKPTRITFDGERVWQLSDNLEVRLVGAEDQRILNCEPLDTRLVSGTIFARSWFGGMYVRTTPAISEDQLLMEHLGQVQWVPVEVWDD